MFNRKELNHMNKKSIRSSTLFALGAAAVATFGLASCNTGTEPGDVNVDRGEIHEEGSMIGDEPGNTTRYSDTADTGEEYYETGNKEGSAVNTGDGEEGAERGEEQ